jgi:RHS repeat-associated protein
LQYGLAHGEDLVRTEYAYAPYGATREVGSDDWPLQFTGRENDLATNLYYYRARYYSPQLGRFISEDPIRLYGGINFYAYARGNPISYTDPLGLWSFTIGGYVGIGTELRSAAITTMPSSRTVSGLVSALDGVTIPTAGFQVAQKGVGATEARCKEASILAHMRLVRN